MLWLPPFLYIKRDKTMKHITIITALALLLSTAVMAQSDNHKGDAAAPATTSGTPAADHSHDGQATPATGGAVRSVDHSHDAVPAQRSTATTTAPAAKPATSSHPYVAPRGKEAANHKAPAARPAHSGATPVRQPQGKEAAGHKTPAARPQHSGPTPVRVNRTEPQPKK